MSERAVPDPGAVGWVQDQENPDFWTWKITDELVEEAPDDGAQYGRESKTWTEIVMPEIPEFVETDPTVPDHVKEITDTQISNWDTASGAVFDGANNWNVTYTIVNEKESSWDNAVNWGNHADAGYAKYSDNPAQFDETLYATKLWAAPRLNGTNEPTMVIEGVNDPAFGLKPALYSPVYQGLGLLFQSGNAKAIYPTNENGHATSNALSLGSNNYRFNQAHFSSLYIDGNRILPNALYYYLSTAKGCPEKTNPQLRMGRSASQYCTFGGTSGGNWLHSTSAVDNPKSNFYITVGSDQGETVDHIYTFNAGSLTLESGNSFVTAGNGGWTNATHGGGWNMSDATWIRATGSKAVYVANNGANAISTAGDVVAYYSDERLKDVQGPIENPLDKVDAIETFYYTHNDIAKSLGYEGDDVQVGVSAQSVKAVMPEVVCRAPVDMDADGGSLSGEDYMTVKYERLVPLLLESIKELRKEIEELKRG